MLFSAPSTDGLLHGISRRADLAACPAQDKRTPAESELSATCHWRASVDTVTPQLTEAAGSRYFPRPGGIRPSKRRRRRSWSLRHITGVA
jgi:hypothetical protein